MAEQVLSGLAPVSTHLYRCASMESLNKVNWSIMLVQPLLYVSLYVLKEKLCLDKFNKMLAPLYA